MKEMEYRILDLLLQNIGSGMSVNELNRKISDKYGLKHSYKEVYQRIRELENEGFIKVQTAGRASILSLNFGNFLTSGTLAIFELEKRQKFMHRHPELTRFFEDIDIGFRPVYTIEFIALAKPEKSRITNSWDLLFVLHRLPPITDYRDGRTESAEELKEKEYKEIKCIFSTLETLEKQHNLKINALVLYSEEFQSDISSEEGNQTKKFIGDSMLLKNPEDFWRELRILEEKGFEFRPGKIPEPPGITEGCLQFNLSRFGYSSFLQGRTEKKETGKISIETLIATILLKQDIRLIEAIPVLMTKTKINQRSLLFFSKKYGLINKAGFLLEITKAFLKDNEMLSEIEEILGVYKKLKSDDEESFMPDSKRGRWKLAMDWKIITNLSMDDFKEKARLYNAA